MNSKTKLNKTAGWITWEIQVRNRSMSSALGVPLFEVLSKKSKLLKYPELIFKTINIIAENKIKILFVQNPSIVLSFLAVCLKPIFGLTVIVDAHNSGIFPLEGRSKILSFFARIICKTSNYTIVSNHFLAETVAAWDGNPIVVPDPIPNLAAHRGNPQPVSIPYILFICTWAADEPYHEIIKAAQLLKNGISIYMTGKYQGKLTSSEILALPQNIKLLGFVSESDYINYFEHATGVIDLTTRDNCLVCGAYEATELGIPAILSNSFVNKNIFSQGFVFTENNATAISESIEILINRNIELRKSIRDFKDIYMTHHATQMRALQNILE